MGGACGPLRGEAPEPRYLDSLVFQDCSKWVFCETNGFSVKQMVFRGESRRPKNGRVLCSSRKQSALANPHFREKNLAKSKVKEGGTQGNFQD